MNIDSYIIIVLPLVVAAVIIGLALVWWRRRGNHSLDLKLLKIKLSQSQKEEKEKDPSRHLMNEINRSEQLFNTLSSIGRPFVFEASVHNSGEEIYFYLSVPEAFVDFATRQVQGLFPDSQVELVPDYTVFAPGDFVSGGFLDVKDSFVVPIRTYKESEIDTFAPIVSTISKLKEVGEGASIQLLMRPAGSLYKKRLTSTLERLRRGWKMSDAKDFSFFSRKFVRDMLKELMTSQADKDKQNDQTKKVVDDDAIKAVQLKSAKPLFEVSVRLITSAKTQEEADSLLVSVAGSLTTQFAAPLRNSIFLLKPRNLRKLVYCYIFRDFSADGEMVLNSEEVASLFHLPIFSTDVPRIEWLKTGEAAPPANLPVEGVMIGESVFRGETKPVRITRKDRQRHLYLVGQTGVGKSYAMYNAVIQDMENGDGVCFIDPHGSAIEEIISRVPKHRIDDIIYFDPGDLRRPMGINMLEYDFTRPEQKTFIVNEIQAIFNRLFDKETMGPMFEQYMRNSLLLLMEDARNEAPTLMEVPRIFTDPEYRNKKIARITNPTVIDFWTKEAIKTTGEQGLANMTPYITSKFGNFIANDYMRPIIGQQKSAFNFREVMDQKKILLVNLSKGRIGDINANLLGMIFTSRLLMAALSRVDQPEEKRNDFYLYIDEFQNFTTDSIGVILSEARKYKLNLTIAHQFIDQLTEEIRNSVFGNVGSMISFRVGSKDAEFLVKQFGPEFSEKDLITVPNYNAFIKMLIGGEPARPFNLRTVRLPDGSAELADKLKELSRLTYGRDLAEVEADILARLRS